MIVQRPEEQRPMAFQGFEAARNTLKYRCPAAAYGLKCDGRETCYRQAGTKAGDYGRIVRIDIKKQDRRIFTPTPYAFLCMTVLPGDVVTIGAVRWNGLTAVH